MAFKKEIPSAESTTYCYEIIIRGHESVSLSYTNTHEGFKGTELKTPQECMDDGAITLEEQALFSEMLGKLADFYNPDKV